MSGSLADQVFDAQHALAVAEDRFCEATERILGGELWDWTWDYYDRSFELHGVPVGFDLTDDQMAAFAGIGFFQCWLNYATGTERHYWFTPLGRGELRSGRGTHGSMRALASVVEQWSTRGGRDARTAERARAALEWISAALAKSDG